MVKELWNLILYKKDGVCSCKTSAIGGCSTTAGLLKEQAKMRDFEASVSSESFSNVSTILTTLRRYDPAYQVLNF